VVLEFVAIEAVALRTLVAEVHMIGERSLVQPLSFVKGLQRPPIVVGPDRFQG
jgi:hypothetical protein